VNPTNSPYVSNSVVTLTATGALNWAFDHWTGDATGSQNPLNVTMNGPRNVQAVFVQTAYPLTVSSPGGGNVTANGLTISPATYYPTGSVVTLAAVTSNGWSFMGWQGSSSSTSNPLNVTINQTNNIQAIFGTVVATNTAGGGSIVLSQPNPVPYGTILTASAIPAPGKYFVTWSGGAASGTNAPTTITVTNANPTINALFTTLPGGKYSLSVAVIGNGSVTISPQQSYYNPGDSVTLKAATNAGINFYGWAQDASGANNPLTVVMNTNKNVLAYFTPLPTPTIPVITGSPVAAPVGTSITISGTNFSPVTANNTVYFGAVQATVTAASGTKLTVTVPVGATFAPITVTVNGLTAYANEPFTPTFPGSGQVSFTLSSSPGVGSDPNWVTAADVNGDGRVDLISANETANTLSVLTNNGSGGFVTAGTYAVGNTPASVVAADVNGDGKLDLISANYNANTLSVLTNDGHGNFALASSPDVGSNPYGVVAADVNGDGKVDLICANSGDNTLSVLTNNGNGGFVLAATMGVGNHPDIVVAADVNGDGKVDLICANQYGSTLSVLTNNGSGGFATAGTYAVGNQPTSVAAADVNGDGKLDLISANYGNNTLSVLTNDGHGNFALASSPGAGTNPYSVVAADVNGDGAVDLICAHYEGNNSLSVLTNNGSGGFVLATSPGVGSNPLSVVAADVNGDGKVDLISANIQGNNLSVLTNATLFRQATPVITSFTPQSGTVGAMVNINGLNFGLTPGNNTVYFGAVQTTVSAASVTNLTVNVPVGATFAPITVTVNGLTAYADQPFTPTFPGSGQINSSSLAPFVNLATPSGPGQVVIADMDGDGKPDLIIADSYAGEISIYRNISTNGSLTAGSFAPRVDLPLLPTSGTNPYRIVAADLDGDGRLDIIALNPDSNVVSILRNISSPGSITTNSFATRIDLPAGNVMRGLVVQDLNGDGKPEIVTANYGDNTISVFQNMSTVGNIAFAARVDFAAGNGPQGLAIGDLDGDGNPDLVVANWNDSTISIFRNLGMSGNITINSFAPKVDFPALATPFPIAIGDLDGDGKLDLVVGGNENSSAISIYRNTSTVGSITTNSFAAPVNFAAPGWVNSITLADLDGDGKLDIALVSQLSSVFSIFKNVSVPGSFTTMSLAARVDYAAGYNPNGIAIGDLDGDGRPDVVFANSYDNTISIYQNIIPFAAAPVITSQPTNQTVIVGGTATFSVTASNTTPLSYQWNFGGTNIPEATNSELTLQDVFPVNAGTYAVAITGVYGSVTSNPAMLRVLPPGITAPEILASGQFQFSFNTATGVDYEVEYSTDLVNWYPLLTVSGNGVPSTFIDPNTAGSPQRFYRIILSPP
jgi:hypothetical protein